MRQANWRLKKTLSRRLEFRPIEQEDMRYIWAAYKGGSLASMGGAFSESEMNAEEFKTAFEAEITTRYHAAWTMFAETKRGFVPVGFVLGFYAHPEPQFAPYMIVGGIVWFGWASKRNIIECTVKFFNEIRNTLPMIGYANEEHKRLYEIVAMHGIMRRVGTSHNVFDGPAAVFETRKKT